MSKSICALALISAAFLAGCTAIRQQKAQAPRADNLEFHNLRILPPNLTHDQLISTMRGIARSLGVKCNHCHVENPEGSKEQFNFPSDAKSEKNVARTMLRMVRTVNKDYVSKVNEHGVVVGCWTCHRGRTVPETPPPAPQP